MRWCKFFLIVVLIFLFNITFSQDWAPVGAKWYYEDYLGQIPYTGIHYQFEVLSDTTINGQPCRKIQITYYGADIQTLSPEYMFSDSGKVYYYRYNKFNLLYDFNAQAGDTILVIDPEYDWTNPDTISATVVDSVRYLFEVLIDSTMFTGNDSLRVQFTRPADINTGLWFKDPIIENIGCTYWMFPLPPFAPPEEDRTLRCYQDSLKFFKIYPNTCDYWIASVNELIKNDIEIRIYPNPANDNLTIEFEINEKSNALFSIYDYTGKEIKRISTKQLPKGKHQAQINTGQWIPGIYLLVANIIGQLRTMKFVKM